MRWIPTLQQVQTAARNLPSPYQSDERSHHRVYVTDFDAVRVYRDLTIYGRGEDTVEVHILDFRLESRRDPNGFRWKRWVYEGPVAV